MHVNVLSGKIKTNTIHQNIVLLFVSQTVMLFQQLFHQIQVVIVLLNQHMVMNSVVLVFNQVSNHGLQFMQQVYYQHVVLMHILNYHFQVTKKLLVNISIQVIQMNVQKMIQVLIQNNVVHLKLFQMLVYTVQQQVHVYLQLLKVLVMVV